MDTTAVTDVAPTDVGAAVTDVGAAVTDVGAAVTDVAPTAALSSLPPEERRKILLESLREVYPSMSKVSRPVSSRVSQYVSQFASGRWRERIWFSDESVDSEDLESEMTPPEEPQLVIFGHNLHSEDYLKEREMMARWNIVERELHFPDLEKGYIQRRDAKTQSGVVLQPNIQTPTTKDADVVTEPTTEDVPMEECKESPQKVTEDNENSPPCRGLKSSVGSEKLVTDDSPPCRGLKSSVGSEELVTDDSPPGSRGLKSSVGSEELVTDDSPPGSRGLKSSVGSEELDSKVEEMQDGNEIVEQASAYSDQESKPIGAGSKAPEEIQSSTQHESLVPPEDKKRQGKMATASEDSKDVATEMKMLETISNEETPLEGQSVSNTESSVSKVVKEVSAVPDPKLAETAKTENSGAISTESGAEISDSNSKSSTLLEAKESVEKMEVSTIPEDSRVESSEKVLETSTVTSTGKKSVSITGSSNVAEVKGPADKMDTESFPEQSKVARISETDAETSGSNLRGKRKADSVTEDDPDEKRTKKTSAD